MLSEKGSLNLPQLPDLFGYVFGFLLIWLFFTGVQASRLCVSGAAILQHIPTKSAAVEVKQEPPSAKQHEEKKISAKELAAAAAAKIGVGKDQDWTDKLNILNSGINKAVSITSDSLHGLLKGDTGEESAPSSSPKPGTTDDKKIPIREPFEHF